MNSQQDVFKLTQSYLYYNSNAAIDSSKPVNAEPTTCSISIAELVYFRAIDFELDFPDKYTEEDMFKKLKIALPDVSFTCQINDKTFEHDISITPENKKLESINRSTTNTSVTIEEALKEEFVIIHKKDLIELQKSKHVLKDLLGTIENLNNKLKQIYDDIRTISES